MWAIPIAYKLPGQVMGEDEDRALNVRLALDGARAWPCS